MELPAGYEDLKTKNEAGDSLVKLGETGTVCIVKKLRYYDTEVFTYLRDNPNEHIPRIFDFQEEDGVLTVIEEKIDGVTLDRYLDDNDPGRKERLDILNGILDGLEFLHNAPSPIIHRDLKSSNILIDNESRVKIIDYDAAKIYKKGESRDTVLIGTEGSAAPEQYGFMQSDPRTDIYAVGVLMRELFAGDTYFESIITKATRMDPKNRYRSIREFKRALKYDVGKDYDLYRKPLIVMAGLLAVSVVSVWGYWFTKNGITYDSSGNVIYINPVSQIMDELSGNDPSGGNRVIYTEVTAESTGDMEESSVPDGSSSGSDDPSGAPAGGSGTPSPTLTQTPTPTPYVFNYQAALSEIDREHNYSCSYPEHVSLLMESRPELDRASAERIVNEANIDYSGNALRRGLIIDFNDYNSRSYPEEIRRGLLEAGFTESQIGDNLSTERWATDGTYFCWPNGMSRMYRECLDENRFRYLSQYNAYVRSRGFSQRLIDYMLSDNIWLVTRIVRSKIESGEIIDDIGYMGTTPSPSTSTSPSSDTAPSTSESTTIPLGADISPAAIESGV